MTEEIENYSKISPDSIKQAFWSMEVNEVFEALKTRPSGLEIKEAIERLKIFGNNTVKEPLRLAKLEIIFNQIKNPLILVFDRRRHNYRFCR